MLDAGLSQTIGLKIRNDLLKVNKNPLPDNLQAKDLIKGEASVPATVTDFVRTVVCGVRYNQTEECNRKVDSIS